jgi:hypothetical protein
MTRAIYATKGTMMAIATADIAITTGTAGPGDDAPCLSPIDLVSDRPCLRSTWLRRIAIGLHGDLVFVFVSNLAGNASDASLDDRNPEFVKHHA